jgi:hypothetical protein
MGVDFMNRLYSDYDYPIKTPIIAARTIGTLFFIFLNYKKKTYNIVFSNKGLTVSHRWLPLKNFYYKHALSK